jgi:hypothetical protein
MQKRCEHCQQKFTARANIKNQKYCSNPDCQKARRQIWRKLKLKSDPDYKANQASAQKRWLERNKGYWKEYRRTHPDYTERNRRLQKERNKRRKHIDNEGERHKIIAKSNMLKKETRPISGIYELIPFTEKKFAKKDAYLVQLTVIG